MELLNIEIVNWSAFNNRKDVKHSSWFRLEHTIAFDPEWDHFSAHEKWIWVWILSLASFKNRGVVQVSSESIAAGCKVSVDEVLSSIQKLAEKDCVRLASRGRANRNTRALRTRSTTDRTDGQDEHNGQDGEDRTGSPLPELALLWNQHRHESLPAVTTVAPSGKRGKAIAERWSEKPDPIFWAAVITRISASSFCRGRNDRGWKANIDFLCRPDTASKALEGQYDDREGQTSVNAVSRGNQALMEKVQRGEL